MLDFDAFMKNDVGLKNGPTERARDGWICAAELSFSWLLVLPVS